MRKTYIYDPNSIETKWQNYWEKHKTFKTIIQKGKPKYYVLDMFPYPSSSGLHVGHPEGYTATDIVARYKRMKGYNVLHPMGWDAFGLPAEQHALKTGVHPAISTSQNIENFKKQLKRLGFSYDWDREINTSSSEYYKWTQWIFLKLYEKGLVYQANIPVNWCPKLGTVLANEEVINGKSEIGNYPVERKPMKQWVLKITAYAERLLKGLDTLDWPESVKQMQRNWIGKSEGVLIKFLLESEKTQYIEAFTTRVETLFGVTFIILAPEHPLVEKITTKENITQVKDYIKACKNISDKDRLISNTKTGIYTGSYAINPINGEKIPIWISDYVLMDYGSGSIMGVPAHDKRDYDFAMKFSLPIRHVIEGENIDEKSDSKDCKLYNSKSKAIDLNGCSIENSQKKLKLWLKNNGYGVPYTQYKLRDWLFSRQRYWGEPIPIIYIDNKPYPLQNDDLPLKLPQIDNFLPFKDGRSPLSRDKNWLHIIDDKTKKQAIRETNTMPQWAGSCWYYLRYISSNYQLGPVDPEFEKYWMPIDLYIGGGEHAVLHLLYARFWHKVLYDCGIVSTDEPFKKLVNQGMILGEVEYTGYKQGIQYVSFSELKEDVSYQKVNIDAREVEKKDNKYVLKGTDIDIEARSHKMSKSRNNVINPDDIIEQYGADALRMYEMFMGPLEQVKPWNTKDISGIWRFLKKIWKMFIDENTGCISGSIQDMKPSHEEKILLHQTIKKVSEDIERLHFNTAISALMITLNKLSQKNVISYQTAKAYILLLSPFAPFISEEIWSLMGNKESLAYHSWPTYDETIIEKKMVQIIIQVNGVLRSKVNVSNEDAHNREKIITMTYQDQRIKRYVSEKEIKKIIFVPGRILNIVLNPN